MHKRPVFQSVKSRILEQRKFIQVILGPRQVGKTTLIKQLLDDIDIPSFYITADNINLNDTSWIEAQWEAARFQNKNAGTKDFLFVIDEIQKIKNWSEAIKEQWDKDTLDNNTVKLILLGSSQLMLQKGLSESLAGRFEVIPMLHWTFNEMNESFGFNEEQYVLFGGYPGSADLIGDEERWKNYITNSLIETTISKDIFQITRIDKPALLKRLFELGCFYSGQILSYNKILGQLQDAGNTTTLSHYLFLLDNAGLVTGIEKFYVEKVRQKASSPKLMVQNTALMTAIADETMQQSRQQPERWGRLVESAVGSHLLNFSKQGYYKLYYWRDSRNEVDFVLEKHGKIIALEVKSGSGIKMTGLNTFKKRYNPHKIYLIGKTGIPWEELIKINPVELF
ncbi:MAG: ATP-binding protein [Bacteroidales bacterium]|nr:ATP-binding protein [Bacteroidales bacterium]